MVNGVTSLKTEAVAVAYAQFRETGELSMRKAADSLNVSATALYHHFANKQALLDAVADRAFSEFEKASPDRRKPLSQRRSARKFWINTMSSRQMSPPVRIDVCRAASLGSKFPVDFAAHRSAVFNLLWKVVDDTVGLRSSRNSGESLYLAHDLCTHARSDTVMARWPVRRRAHLSNRAQASRRPLHRDTMNRDPISSLALLALTPLAILLPLTATQRLGRRWSSINTAAGSTGSRSRGKRGTRSELSASSIRPAKIDRVVDLQARWVVPPYAEGHNHWLEPHAADAYISAYLRDGSVLSQYGHVPVVRA